MKIGVSLKVTNLMIVGYRLLCWKVASLLQLELYVSTVRIGADISAGTQKKTYTQTVRQKNKLWDIGQFLIGEEPKEAGRRAFSLDVMTRTSYFFCFARHSTIALVVLVTRSLPSAWKSHRTETNKYGRHLMSEKKKKTFISKSHLLIRTLTNVHFNSRPQTEFEM